MFAPIYFNTQYFEPRYFPPGLVLVLSYAGAYAIVVELNPSTPDVEFTHMRGMTMLVPKADLEDATMGAVTHLKPRATIQGGMSGSTIERVK